jgi:leader peptidase (prepilin peptidase) / N-methyltransferase
MELFVAFPAAFVAAAVILGLLVGSFLNVVIHRLPKMMERDWQAQCAELRGETIPEESNAENLWRPRSRCPHCGHQITALENIPVISYLWLRGHCSGCQAGINLRYPAVELLTAVLSGIAAWKFGAGLPALGAIGLIWALIALAFIDADTQLLPDDITLPLLWLGLLLNLFGTYTSLHDAVIGAMAGGTYASLHDAVIGAMAGYLALWSVYWLFKLVTGKEGMGYGDFKLLAALGAWMGWQMLPVIILLSSVVGAVLGIALMVFARHGRGQPMPFGPYLAGAGVLALFVGHEINTTYLGLF